MSCDIALYRMKKGINTTGILGTYVDDSMFIVGLEFESVIDQIIRKFDSKSLEWNNADFVGVRVETKHL